MFDPVNRERLVQKLEKYPRPENLNSLKSKNVIQKSGVKCSLQSNTRTKDLKTQKMQGCILEAVGAISKVTTHY